MSDLTKIFHISIYGLACLGTLMLGFAEGTFFPQALSIPLALLAYTVTERKKMLSLPVSAANALGLLAFFIAAGELFFGDIEARVLSGAHLLVYLSWIVYFQEKHTGQFWWMCVLGVLQVVVGALLTADASYGFLLLIYLFCSIWTLSVYSLYQGKQQFALSVHQNSLALQSGQINEAIFLSDQQSVSDTLLDSNDQNSFLSESHTTGSIRLDPNEKWVNSRLFFGTLGMSALALVVASGFFLMIPRAWFGARLQVREDPSEAIQTQTGFSEEVRLGEMGTILESTRRVLQVQFFDQDTDQQLDIMEYVQSRGYDEPLFRGQVLNVYREGRWRAEKNGFGLELMRPRKISGSIRQVYHMEPLKTDVLFAFYPVQNSRIVSHRQNILISKSSSVMLRNSNSPIKGQLAYTVFSPKLDHRDLRDWRWPRAIETLAKDRYLGMPRRDLKRLVQLSREISGIDAPGKKPSREEMAARIETYLRDSGNFRYSLNSSVINVSLDPVEDFLFNRKEGHCEYFASALALMLRAVGIPARLVSGFKGGEINSFSGVFEVQERHAHAWVEAAIDKKWVVMDATPASERSASVDQFAPAIRAWHELVSLFKQKWTDLIVNMNFAQQQKSLYGPLKESIVETWRSVISGKGASKGAIAELGIFLSSPDRWFSWQGGVLTWILLFLLAGGYWLSRRLFSWLKHLRLNWNKLQQSRKIRIEFYERFRNICKKHGLYRLPAQTQREFASDVFDRLNGSLVSSGLQELPADLTGSFYRVRFGTDELEPKEIRQLNDQLSQFELALSRPK